MQDPHVAQALLELGRGALGAMSMCPIWTGGTRLVADQRPLCRLSSKRLEDNWHSGRLSSTKHRLLERRSPEWRRVKRPLRQLSTKHLEDNWHGGLFFLYTCPFGRPSVDSARLSHAPAFTRYCHRQYRMVYGI